MRRIQRPTLGRMRRNLGGKATDLLLNGLVLDLVAGRDAAVDRYPHGIPPAGSAAPAPPPAPEEVLPPTAEEAGRPGPNAADRPPSAHPCAGPAKCAAVACSSPR